MSLLDARLCGLVLLLTVGLAPRPARADDAAKARAAEAFFEKSVRPVLVAKCFDCHGVEDQQLGLRLDSREAILKGSDEGKVVSLDRPEKSSLLVAIRREEFIKMPPDEELSTAEVAALTKWVKLGLPWPKSAKVEGALPNDLEAGLWKSHWAFQPIRERAVPGVKNRHWPNTPIDRFILARLEAEGLSPSQRAERRMLIRRATFDLVGLPPTPEEVREFVSDDSPDAFHKLIERLLASPRYGERWGRYWLDVARYADNKGYVFFEEKTFPWAHTYRDYVIRSFNEDLPYNRFLLEQLAADQLELGDDKRPLAAMGFLTLGPRFMNNTHDVLDDRIDVVTRGLLGLTATCARCHEHKYDPIPTEDYYSLYGIFRSSVQPQLPPLFEPPPETEAYKKFATELATRQKKLGDFVNRVYDGIADDARTRAADYLLSAHAKRNQPKTEQFMLLIEKGDLHPTMIHRWEGYLERTRKSDDPIWRPWHAFAELADEEFQAKASEVTSALLTSNDPDETVPPLVRELFDRPAPASMKDVAQRYGELLTRIETRWTALLTEAAQAKQPPPTRMPDVAEEALRQVLHGADSAPMIPRTLGFGFLSLIPDRPTQAEYKKLLKEVETHSANGTGAPPRAMVLVDSARAYDPRVFLRGNPARPGKAVPRRFLGMLDPERTAFTKGSGRLELARAVVDPRNPLTARVIVNRIWMRHFGKAIVATTSDLGLRGAAPSHPELIEHLASTFIRNGWSVKDLHRRIMLSAAYQQSSQSQRDDEDGKRAETVDPENRLLWRFNRQRLDFEATRDSLLAVSGSLQHALGGKPVNLQAGFVPRRTVYGFVDRMDLPNLFRTFDFPDPAASSPGRDTTTVAPQALFLMNNDFVAQCAQRLLQRSGIATDSDVQNRVEGIYQHLFNREPTASERSLAQAFLSSGSKPGSGGWKDWQYGYGRVDENAGRVATFVKLPHWTGSYWQCGPKLPDPKLGWVFLEATGGHPSASPERLAIRRWVAPRNATITINGNLAHASDKGNGVGARVISSRNGLLGEWTVHDSTSKTSVKTFDVVQNETVDFVVDSRGQIGYDNFDWVVNIESPDKASVAEQTREWNSKTDFRGNGQDRWQQYVQALLLTNEFVFVD